MPAALILAWTWALLTPLIFRLARTLAPDSSALFARNLANFLTAFWDKDAGAPLLADEDEIVKAIRLTKGGAVVTDRLG